MNSLKQQAGHLGGMATFLRHGCSYMKEIGRRGGELGGKLGGRPPLLSISQLTASKQNNGKGGVPPHGNSLKTLKALWASQRSSQVVS